MWDHRRSILLSKIGVVAFAVLIGAGAVYAPWMVRYVVEVSQAGLEGKEIFFYLTLYGGCIPALAMLCELYRILQRISGNQVFVRENVAGLRRVSWCSILGGGICLVSMLYYLPFGVIAFAAAFVGVIVRVVKNVLAKAVELKEEADFTI